MPTHLFIMSVIQIIGIDVILSGDNAVVIAMACRSLPPRQRKIGISLGVAAALVLRIAAAAAISYVLAVPFLRAVGGLVLLYIGTKVIKGEGDGEDKGGRQAAGLMTAVWLIVVADITMSLDNVVAIAGAADGDDVVFIIGLALSMPLMMVGASMISGLMTRFPIIVWAGGALLGWIAGGMIATDPSVMFYAALPVMASQAMGALLVVVTGAAFIWFPRRRRRLA